jgi:hypothetical protein
VEGAIVETNVAAFIAIRLIPFVREHLSYDVGLGLGARGPASELGADVLAEFRSLFERCVPDGNGR